MASSTFSRNTFATGDKFIKPHQISIVSSPKGSSITSMVYNEIKRGNYMSAVKHLQAISIDQEPSESLLSLMGYCHYMSQDFIEASSCYSQLCTLLDPGLDVIGAEMMKYIEYSFNHAHTLYLSGDFDLSIRVTISLDKKLDKLLNQVENISLNSRSESDLLALEVCGDYKARLKTIQALIKFSQNDIAAARSIFDPEINSNEGESKKELENRMFNLASCLTKQNLNLEAIVILQSMLDSAQGDDDKHTKQSQLDIRYNLALNYYKLEKYNEALDLLGEIIKFGVSAYLELNIGSNTNDLEINSVGNSHKLENSCLVEAFNLKAAIKYELGDVSDARQALTDMPPRNQNELDSITLHNQGLFSLESEPLASFDKLKFLLDKATQDSMETNSLPDETFINILLVCIMHNYHDMAAQIMMEDQQFTFKYLSEELYEFLEAVLTRRSSDADCYRKLDQLLERQMEKIKILRSKVEQTQAAANEHEFLINKLNHNNELELGIQILMNLGLILWDSNHLKALERLFRKSAEIFSDHPTWKLNVAHTLYMQDCKFQEVLLFYEPFIRDNFKQLLSVDPMIIANLCVSYVLIGQNEDAQELMRKVESEESELMNNSKSKQPTVARQTLIKLKNSPRLSSIEDGLETKSIDLIYNDRDKTNQLDVNHYIPMHSCIINLVIGTLYCVKFNYEFGLARIIKSVEPIDKKLNPDTWFYAKRCMLSMVENVSKMIIVVSDRVLFQCIDFLMECEKHGLAVKASSQPTSLDGLGKDTVAYEARYIRCLMLRLIME